MMDIRSSMHQIGRRAREASRAIARADTATKNGALAAVAAAIRRDRAKLVEINAQDVARARASGEDAACAERLAVPEKSAEAMPYGVEHVARLTAPIGEISDLVQRPTGIKVGRMRVPLGVIGIIYESRPNVTADAAALCIKSGNACILRGGSESVASNLAI